MRGLFGRKRHERAGYALYTESVRAAREAWSVHQALGVPDTLDGRFDMVGAHVFLVIDRLRAAPDPGPALSQAVFDAMFADMDFNLREMGVGDMSVGKRVKEMWEAFHGRAQAYEAAMQDADRRGAGGSVGPQRVARRGAGWLGPGAGRADAAASGRAGGPADGPVRRMEA